MTLPPQSQSISKSSLVSLEFGHGIYGLSRGELGHAPRVPAWRCRRVLRADQLTLAGASSSPRRIWHGDIDRMCPTFTT